MLAVPESRESANTHDSATASCLTTPVCATLARSSIFCVSKSTLEGQASAHIHHRAAQGVAGHSQSSKDCQTTVEGDTLGNSKSGGAHWQDERGQATQCDYAETCKEGPANVEVLVALGRCAYVSERPNEAGRVKASAREQSRVKETIQARVLYRRCQLQLNIQRKRLSGTHKSGLRVAL